MVYISNFFLLASSHQTSKNREHHRDLWMPVMMMNKSVVCGNAFNYRGSECHAICVKKCILSRFCLLTNLPCSDTHDRLHTDIFSGQLRIYKDTVN